MCIYIHIVSHIVYSEFIYTYINMTKLTVAKRT